MPEDVMPQPQETKPTVSSPEPVFSLNTCGWCGKTFGTGYEGYKAVVAHIYEDCDKVPQREEKGSEKETEAVSFSDLRPKQRSVQFAD
jgi:hypothetical protein